MGTPLDANICRRVLNAKRTELISSLYPDILLDVFLEQELISVIIYRDIQELPLTSQKNRKILDLVLASGYTGYVKFKECLKRCEQKHLVDILEEEEKIVRKKPLEQVPESGMDYSQNIPADIDLLNIAQQIGGNPEFVGAQLGISSSQIQQVKQNHQGDVVMQVFNLLIIWRQSSRENPTFLKLLNELEHLRSSVHMEFDKIQAIAKSPDASRRGTQQPSFYFQQDSNKQFPTYLQHTYDRPPEARNEQLLSVKLDTVGDGHTTVGQQYPVYPYDHAEDIRTVPSNIHNRGNEIDYGARGVNPVSFGATGGTQSGFDDRQGIGSSSRRSYGQPLESYGASSQFHFADTRRLGEFSNIPGPDYSGGMHSDNIVPSLGGSQIGSSFDTTDAVREQRPFTAKPLETPRTAVSTHSTSVPVSLSSHGESGKTYHETIGQATNALETAGKALKKLHLFDPNYRQDQSETHSKHVLPRVTAVPNTASDQVDSEDPVSKQRVQQELSNLSHDGRLMTLSVDCFEHIIRQKTKTLVHGGFGTVYICSTKEKLLDLGIPVVVKKIDCTKRDKHKMMSITNEKLGSRTMHFAIVPLLGMTEDYSKSTFYFLSPYLENGDLSAAIARDTAVLNDKRLDADPIRLTRPIRMKIIYHISSALDYLHTKVEGYRGTIIHMDVKSLNVVLDRHFNARLIDFGLAREMNESSQTGISVTSTEVPGSLGYYRTIQYKRLTVKEDSHNFGIVIRELLTGKPPYENEEEVPLKDMDKENIKAYIQTIWCEGVSDSKVALKLNELASDCIALKVLPGQVKSYIEKELHLEKRWKRDESHDRCEMCMINKSAPEAEKLLLHSQNCRQKMLVCVACMRNSFLNPIICHTCGEKINPLIGNGWGALLIAGNECDANKQAGARGMSEDITRIHDVLISKCPLVMGIPEKNVKVVKPAKPGHPERMMPKLRNAVDHLKELGNIHMLIIYFAGHHFPEKGFLLGNRDEFMSVEHLQHIMNDIASSNTAEPVLHPDFSKKRFLVLLDCCNCPVVGYPAKRDEQRDEKYHSNNVGDQQAGDGNAKDIDLCEKQSQKQITISMDAIPDLTRSDCCVMQISACRPYETSGGGEEGSVFSKLFVQALTQQALGTQCLASQDVNLSCENHAPICGDFIFLDNLFRYINEHMKLLKKRVPTRSINVGSWFDSMIAYNVKFEVALEFKVKEGMMIDQQSKSPIRLKPHLYSEMRELKEVLFEKLLDKTMKDVKAQRHFAESVCIEIDRGPKLTEELDTISKVNAAWNSRRDLAVSLRKERNVHRGLVLVNTTHMMEIRKYSQNLKKVSGDNDPYDLFTTAYSDVNIMIDNFAHANDDSLKAFKQLLVNIREGVKNAKNIEVSDETELQFYFPKPIQDQQENFMCFELKKCKHKNV